MRLFVYSMMIWLITTVGISQNLRIGNDVVGFADISLNKSDPGISWMMNQWHKSPKDSPIKSFTRQIPTNRAYLSVYNQSQKNELTFVIEAQTKDNLDSNTMKNKIANILKSEITLPKFKTISFKGVNINTGPRYFNKGEVFYYTRGNKLFSARNQSIINKTIDLQSQGQNSISTLPDYQDMIKRIGTNMDVILYFNNSKSQFANALNRQEKKWQMSFLLSSNDLSSIILGIDFVDGNTIKGKAIFKAKSSSTLPDIQDDAKFLGEAIRREFSFTEIRYKRSIKTQGNYVTLEFEMNGLKPLFQELFNEGISSLIN